MKHSCLHNKVALPIRRHSVLVRKEKSSQKNFQNSLDQSTQYRKCYSKDELFMTLMKFRLDFPFTDFPLHFIIGGLCTQVFYSSAWGKRWLEVNCVIKLKVINVQPQPKYKTRNFQNNKEKISQRHSVKPKTNWNFKVLPGLSIYTIKQLNFLFVFFCSSTTTLV